MEDYKKKYEDALERARRMCAMPIDKATMEYVFPELGEDERVRRFLQHTFAAQYLAKDMLGKWHGEPVTNILAWLEKVKDFDKQLEEAYKTADEVQYKRGYDAAMMEITCTEREAAAKTIRELQERINELSHKEVSKKSEQDEPTNWTEEDEKLLNGIYNTLEGIAPLSYEKELDWLKSIKERLQ